MRKFPRRPRFRARSARQRTDSRQFNLCGLEMSLTGAIEPPANTCLDPYKNWTPILYPIEETSGALQPAVSRGLVFSRARWKYCYTLRDVGAGTSDGFYNSLFIRSALVVAQTDNGAPISDADGNLIPLFNRQGDLPSGLVILWRSLDRLANMANGAAGYDQTPKNVYSLPLPLERFSGRVRLHEGYGVFWVTEIVSGNPALNAHVALDVTMSYRVGNL